jgi:hypothetical protein
VVFPFLVVYPFKVLLDHTAAAAANSGRISLAPDVYHKAELSGGAPHKMALPDVRADGELPNKRQELFFVYCLRLALRWGGLPYRYGVIEVLRADLLAF